MLAEKCLLWALDIFHVRSLVRTAPSARSGLETSREVFLNVLSAKTRRGI